MFVKIFLLNFHPKANFSGREQSPSTPKYAPNPEGTRSRIEYHRVQEKRKFSLPLFLLL